MVCYWILLPALLRALSVSDRLFPLLLALGREEAGNGACQEPQKADLHPLLPRVDSAAWRQQHRLKLSRLEWAGISEPSGLFYPFPRATGTPGGSYNPLTTIQQPNYTSPPPGNQLGVPKLEHPEPLVSAR